MYRLTKNFRFESAHRLAKGYEGKCKNIHGHSWNGVLEVEVEEQDEKGFAVDFKDLSKTVKEWEELLDHKILLYHEDHSIINLCIAENWEYLLLNENPTCETIAKLLFSRAVAYFYNIDRAVRVRSVTIHETCTTGCTYYEHP